MTYIITAKTTYQTSEDTWERALITRTADDNTTVKEIFEWAEKKGVDENTIRIHPDSQKEETI